jgi:hypothetical protein
VVEDKKEIRVCLGLEKRSITDAVQISFSDGKFTETLIVRGILRKHLNSSRSFGQSCYSLPEAAKQQLFICFYSLPICK